MQSPSHLISYAYVFMRFTIYIVNSCSSSNKSDFTASIDSHPYVCALTLLNRLKFCSDLPTKYLYPLWKRTHKGPSYSIFLPLRQAGLRH